MQDLWNDTGIQKITILKMAAQLSRFPEWTQEAIEPEYPYNK
jgi:hypothetical protein